MDSFSIALWASAGLVVLVLAGVRVAFAAAFAGFVGLCAIFIGKRGWGDGVLIAIEIAGAIPHSKSTTYALSLIPVFILIGFFAHYAGLTRHVFDAAKKWVGWLPGGLGVATVFATAGFAAVSGASAATAAIFARVAIPEMLAARYDKRFAAGVVAAGGTLASLIPPSAILVIYAIITEQSVGHLLLAGFLPGAVSALVYAALVVFLACRDKGLGPPAGGFSWRERFLSLPPTAPVFAVIFIILYAVYFGWATPTEAGALGAVVVAAMAARSGMRRAEVRDALMETAKLTAMIFAMIWGVLIYVRLLGFADLPGVFAQFVAGLEQPRIVTLLMILAAYAVLGMFMDAIGMMVLTLPVVFPAVVALGYDPIWFGIIVVKMAELCLITPPIGLNCFVVAGARPDIPVHDVFRGVTPFFVADFVTIAILIAFPEITLWLPSLALGAS